MKNVLIVCTANKTRSPMAMEIANKIAANKKLDGRYFFNSAGIAVIGNVIDSNAAKVLAEIGIETAFTPQSIDRCSIANYDEFHVMTDRQKITLSSLYGAEYQTKTIVLGVDDPFGKGIDEYRKCRDFFLKFYDEYIK